MTGSRACSRICISEECKMRTVVMYKRGNKCAYRCTACSHKWMELDIDIPSAREYIDAFNRKLDSLPDREKNLAVEWFLPFMNALHEQEWVHRDCPPDELTDNDI